MSWVKLPETLSITLAAAAAARFSGERDWDLLVLGGCSRCIRGECAGEEEEALATSGRCIMLASTVEARSARERGALP